MATGYAEQNSISGLVLEIVSPSPSVYGALLPLGKYPLSSSKAAAFATALQSWLDKSFVSSHMNVAVGLQTASMQDALLADTLVDRAAQWIPEVGLGIRPGGEPPRMLRRSDLESLRWDETPRLKHETVVFLEGGTPAALDALSSYCGSGALLLCLLTVPAESYLTAQRDRWRRQIQDRSFRDHPLYLPLIDEKAMRNLNAEEGSAIMGGAVAYFRESPEDGGVIAITTDVDALKRLIADAGFLCDQ